MSKPSQDPWVSIVSKLKLSRAEQAAVKRYELDPQGRGFLAIADILRAHHKIEDSLELLIQGVERHPTFTVARVVLARELYTKGLIAQAWYTLAAATEKMDDNVLAQKLKFKLAILLGIEEQALESSRHLALFQMHDQETKNLSQLLRTNGISKTAEKLRQDLKNTGISVQTPKPEEFLGSAFSSIPDSATHASKQNPPTDKESKKDQLFFDDQEDQSVGEIGADFQVLPLEQIFRGMELNERGQVKNSAELDSTTLAELYQRQGHYTKALDIYRRLLRLTPGSDYLKNKIREIQRLEKSQRDADLSVDPSLVDQIETIELIDKQITFFGELLERLGHRSRSQDRREDTMRSRS